MNIGKWAAGLMVLAAVVFATGCPSKGTMEKDAKEGKAAKDGKEKAKDNKEKPKEEHASEGPHKGAIAEWGNEEYHVEFTVDHDTKSVKVYILGPDVKKPAPIKAEKVMLSVKKPAFQVELKPERQKDDPAGTASVFVGKDDRFGVKQEFEGSLSASFGGKQYAGDFKEKEDHDHKKK